MARDQELPKELLKYFAANPVLLDPIAKHSVVLPTTTVMALQKNIHGPISRIYQLLLYTPTELLANEDFGQVQLDHVTQFIKSRYQQISSLYHHHTELREMDPLTVVRMVAEYKNRAPKPTETWLEVVCPTLEGVTPQDAECVRSDPNFQRALNEALRRVQSRKRAPRSNP